MTVALLDEIKSEASKSDIVRLVGDLASMRLILVWPRVSIIHRSDSEIEKNHDRALPRWRRLWLGYDVDFWEIEALADIPTERDAKRILMTAQALFWVYPDNTVNIFAHQLAQATMTNRVINASKKGKKEKAENGSD